MSEDCVLYDRTCIDCGECDICDLDSNKRCDDCGRCIDESEDYRILDIEEFIAEQEEKEG
ncbi:MAG: hypothetical protein K0R31_1908 [Clostridiales bacterium]|jgi:hypothetical protein|nr:hypothetical protein [Clostridiales bacterium]